jgi:hypothetical protein
MTSEKNARAREQGFPSRPTIRAAQTMPMGRGTCRDIESMAAYRAGVCPPDGPTRVRSALLLFCKRNMEKVCFFIAPIGGPDSVVRRRSDRLLDVLLRPTLTGLGYRVIRVDRLAVFGSLSGQIRALLRQAELVVADLTGANANVFYELGFRHATEKPCLQVIEEGETIPFDVADIRTILVNSSSVSALQNAAQVLAAQVRDTEAHCRPPIDAPSDEELAAFISGSRLDETADAPVSNYVANPAVELQNQPMPVDERHSNEPTGTQQRATRPHGTTDARGHKSYLWRRFLPLAA